LAEAVAPFVHAGAETARPGLPGGKTYTGLDGFRESWLDWLAPWAEYRTEVKEAIDCGERVLLLQSSAGRTATQRPLPSATGHGEEYSGEARKMNLQRACRIRMLRLGAVGEVLRTLQI
jgi:hypothetical protein